MGRPTPTECPARVADSALAVSPWTIRMGAPGHRREADWQGRRNGRRLGSGFAARPGMTEGGGESGSLLVDLLRPLHPGAGFFAVGLGGDFLELAALHGREGLTRRALFRIGEGAAVGLDALADRIEEVALPFGQRNARLLGRAAGAFQGVERRPLGGLTLLLPRAQQRFLFRSAIALRAT
ncbi:hypothetical protein D3C72_992370 [compost metagenome]